MIDAQVADAPRTVSEIAPLAGFINGANLRIDGGFVTSVN